MFEFFIARRYLRAKRKQVVISVITVISVIGVAAGVMALVIALAINNGFRNYAGAQSAGRDGACFDSGKRTGRGIEDWEQLAQKLAKLPHVVSATPGLYESGYISGTGAGRRRRDQGREVAPGIGLPDALKHLKAGSAEGLRRTRAICRASFSAPAWRSRSAR